MLACEQALRSRMGRKESGKGKVWVGEGEKAILILPQALLGSLRSPISLGACSQARRMFASAKRKQQK